ncbi:MULTISPECIES: hypothetical protein [Sphingomonas]|uniref:hypothetical protein n=1 Tax=Sphingomonas TaxID=13687 RepID=UPI00126A5288|nr:MULTISPECIES: hypothetical protein [Sphingomonas]
MRSHKGWAALFWLVLLGGIALFCARYDGPDCTAPRTGPLAHILDGEKFAPTHHRGGCRRVG